MDPETMKVFHKASYDPKVTPDQWAERGGIFKLDCRNALYIPRHYRTHETIPNDLITIYTEATMRFFLQEFGGATNYNAQGFYDDRKTKKVHSEEVVVVESYCTAKTLSRKAKLLRAIGNFLAVEMNQEAITIIVDGTMLFLGPTTWYIESLVGTSCPDKENYQKVLRYFKEAFTNAKMDPVSKEWRHLFDTQVTV